MRTTVRAGLGISTLFTTITSFGITGCLVTCANLLNKTEVDGSVARILKTPRSATVFMEGCVNLEPVARGSPEKKTRVTTNTYYSRYARITTRQGNSLAECSATINLEGIRDRRLLLNMIVFIVTIIF